MSITSWGQTPAGVIRRGVAVPETAAMEQAQEITSHERVVAKRNFDEAWGPVVTAQRQLADRGWTGAWIMVGPTVPPELAPLHALADMARTRSGVAGPGAVARDPLIAEHAAVVADRMRASEKALGPLAGTVG